MNGLLLSAPELAATSDVSVARELLASWCPPSPEQAAVRDRIVAFIDEHPSDAHLRTCAPACPGT